MNQAPHVLLVEDDADFAYLNRCRLEEYGLTTEVCPTLHGALERLDARTGRSFDVVLLDLRLPDTDGLEGVMALRAATDLPIVMLTSTSGTDVAIEAVRLGVDDYLDKAQADADRLVRSLRFAVERRAPGPDGGRPPGSGPVREIPEMFEPVLGDLGRFLGMETMAFHHPDGSGTVWVHRHETSPWLQPREVVRYLEVTIDAVAAGDAPRLAGDASDGSGGSPAWGRMSRRPCPCRSPVGPDQGRTCAACHPTWSTAPIWWSAIRPWRSRPGCSGR